MGVKTIRQSFDEVKLEREILKYKKRATQLTLKCTIASFGIGFTIGLIVSYIF